MNRSSCLSTRGIKDRIFLHSSPKSVMLHLSVIIVLLTLSSGPPAFSDRRIMRRDSSSSLLLLSEFREVAEP